jgi:hypothetical protein
MAGRDESTLLIRSGPHSCHMLPVPFLFPAGGPYSLVCIHKYTEMFDRALHSKYDAFTFLCEKYSLQPNELDVLDNENKGGKYFTTRIKVNQDNVQVTSKNFM